MNGVLPETPFWDELKQKECQSIDATYKKARKYLMLEDSKEALRKTEGTSTGKKNDPRGGDDSKREHNDR